MHLHLQVINRHAGHAQKVIISPCVVIPHLKRIAKFDGFKAFRIQGMGLFDVIHGTLMRVRASRTWKMKKIHSDDEGVWVCGCVSVCFALHLNFDLCRVRWHLES